MPNLNVKGRFLSVEDREYTDKVSQQKKQFHICKVFIDSSDEIAEVFSNKPVPFKRDQIVDVVIRADLSTKKISCNFASSF